MCGPTGAGATLASSKMVFAVADNGGLCFLSVTFFGRVQAFLHLLGGGLLTLTLGELLDWPLCGLEVGRSSRYWSCAFPVLLPAIEVFLFGLDGPLRAFWSG